MEDIKGVPEATDSSVEANGSRFHDRLGFGSLLVFLGSISYGTTSLIAENIQDPAAPHVYLSTKIAAGAALVSAFIRLANESVRTDTPQRGAAPPDIQP